MQGARGAVGSLGWKVPLEKKMTTHSSILAWGIPWTEEAGGLQSMGLQESWTRLSNQTTSDTSRFPSGSVLKKLPPIQETQFRSLGQECPLEKELATQSGFAWEILWSEKPGKLQSMVAKEWDVTQQLNNITTTQQLEWPIHSLTIPMLVESAEQQELLLVAAMRANSKATLEYSLAVSYKARYSLTMQSIICACRFFFSTDSKIYVHLKSSCECLCSHIIINKNWEHFKCSLIGEQINKL